MSLRRLANYSLVRAACSQEFSLVIKSPRLNRTINDIVKRTDARAFQRSNNDDDIANRNRLFSTTTTTGKEEEKGKEENKEENRTTTTKSSSLTRTLLFSSSHQTHQQRRGFRDHHNQQQRYKSSDGGRATTTQSTTQSTTRASSSAGISSQQQQQQQQQTKAPPISQLDKNIIDNVLDTRNVQSLRARLDEIKYTKEFVTMERFALLCEECGCVDKSPMQYVEIMKNAGVVVQIEDYIYLEPQHITRAVINALPGVPSRIYGVADAELKKLNEEYDQMREKVILAEKRAARRANQLLYGGFLILCAQLAVFVRFTYVEFSWDVMEPISYFVGLMNVIMGYMYFMYTQRDFSFGTWQNQVMQSAIDRQLRSGAFDVSKYEQMSRKLRRRNLMR
jgi:calcium uniporter protein, mitochondrial